MVEETNPTSTSNATTSTSTSSSTSTSTTTSTTTTTTTTIPVGREAVERACDVLATGSFVDRSATVAGFADVFAAAGGEGDAVESARTACGEDWDRTADAMAVRARFEAVDSEWPDGPVAPTELACDLDTGDFSVVLTNESAEPIGVNVRFELTTGEGDSKQVAATSTYPIVVWRIEPGESIPSAGKFFAHQHQLVGEIGCSLSYQWFLADRTDADAALAEPTRPELVGDDPAAWFPELLELGEEIWGTGDDDFIGLVEDIRSDDFQHVTDGIRGEQGNRLVVNSVSVCDKWDQQRDEQHRSVVYAVEYGADSYVDESGQTVDRPVRRNVNVGLFRRGSDGQWRWLGRAVGLRSVVFESCEFALPAADQ